MNDNTRRTFLKETGLGFAAVAASGVSTRAAQANERVVVGVIGPGGMGTHHLRSLVRRKDVEVAWVCDVDSDRLARAEKIVKDVTGKPAKAVGDLRKVLDDPRVDAVFIATPDHWHAPASILALEAGKHVYVEKPCSHNIREGRLMTDAVKRSGKLLQVGTQTRSTEFVQDAMKRIHDGAIGEVIVAKAWNSQRRGSIGKSKPTTPPKNLDFDTWIGPAPRVAYRPNMLHSIWRWWYDFGCGDIGNDGVHDIDVALWGLGATTHPTTVTCLGGKYFFDDDQQFPDTQYAVFEYPTYGKPQGRKKQLIFEQRIWSPYSQEDYENGAAFYGTKGMLIVGHTTGWKLYGPRNKLIDQRTGRADLGAHHKNFFDCIRGTQKTLNADVHAGHRAATIVHLANIAARTGEVLQFNPRSEQITNSDRANAFVRRQYHKGHWSVPKGV